MNKEELKIICDTEDLYETCENMEQLFDYYLQLAIEYHNLKQQNQKYKEVIDKAIKLIEDTYYSKNTTDIDSIVLSSNKLLKIREILKEV